VPASSREEANDVQRAWEAAGVEVVFTLCGGHILSICDGCPDEGIRIIDARREQAAVHAADAWACRMGRPGVTVVTVGLRVTDRVTRVANAFRANSPVWVVDGQGPFAQLGRGSLQEMDHVAVMRPITKWAGAVYETERIPEFIELALRHAWSGRSGPVFLEIPLDALFHFVDERHVTFPCFDRPVPRPGPAKMALEQAVRMPAEAQRPVVMAGSAVRRCDAYSAPARFVADLDLPLSGQRGVRLPAAVRAGDRLHCGRGQRRWRSARSRWGSGCAILVGRSRSGFSRDG
jgi:acetolactate synthase I/II/III large subunit